MQKAEVSNIWVRFRKWKTRRIRQSSLFCGDIDLGPPHQAPNNMTVASARNLVPTGSPQLRSPSDLRGRTLIDDSRLAASLRRLGQLQFQRFAEKLGDVLFPAPQWACGVLSNPGADSDRSGAEASQLHAEGHRRLPLGFERRRLLHFDIAF